MTTLEELLRVNGRLTAVHVERWVARGLLRPSADGEHWVFEPVDVARACLLADLTDEMGFDEESMETVVDLLDQVHTLRRQLHRLGLAIGRQPAETREAIAAALQDLAEG
ncbi:MAG: chaperone modulator CbpM [Proteobacteria bacterium]|nr:chaperone modulator CbpM [Pseudomonadota bacterium]